MPGHGKRTSLKFRMKFDSYENRIPDPLTQSNGNTQSAQTDWFTINFAYVVSPQFIQLIFPVPVGRRFKCRQKSHDSY